MILDVFVPKPTERRKLGIKFGSAIVALPSDSEFVTVYFEGNLYDAENLRRFEERLISAAGRLVHKYPTAAFAKVRRCDLILVGQFDSDPAMFHADKGELKILESWTEVCYHVIDVDDPVAASQVPTITSRLSREKRSEAIGKLLQLINDPRKREEIIRRPHRYGIDFPIIEGANPFALASDKYLERL